MNTLLKLCQFPDDQLRCAAYKPKSKTNEKCWRYREELGHCNRVELSTEKLEE